MSKNLQMPGWVEKNLLLKLDIVRNLYSLKSIFSVKAGVDAPLFTLPYQVIFMCLSELGKIG